MDEINVFVAVPVSVSKDVADIGVSSTFVDTNIITHCHDCYFQQPLTVPV